MAVMRGLFALQLIRFNNLEEVRTGS